MLNKGLTHLLRARGHSHALDTKMQRRLVTQATIGEKPGDPIDPDTDPDGLFYYGWFFAFWDGATCVTSFLPFRFFGHYDAEAARQADHHLREIR